MKRPRGFRMVNALSPPPVSLSLPGGDPDDVAEVEHGVAPVARHEDHLAANAPRRIYYMY